MVKIENKILSLKEGVVVLNGSMEKSATTKNLIEHTLNVLPDGGFTPRDLIDRSRIQEVLDKLKPNQKEIQLEDSDFENLKKIVNASRWGIRGKDVIEFINIFI